MLEETVKIWTKIYWILREIEMSTRQRIRINRIENLKENDKSGGDEGEGLRFDSPGYNDDWHVGAWEKGVFGLGPSVIQ